MIFLSYHSSDERFVERVNAHLREHPQVNTYFYRADRRPTGWQQEVGTQLSDCASFVLFLGSVVGPAQVDEANLAYELQNVSKLVVRNEKQTIPQEVKIFCQRSGPIFVEALEVEYAEACANAIVKLLKLDNPFDIPEGYPFDYEKKIIEEYSKGKLDPKWVNLGCPAEWPALKPEKSNVELSNPVDSDIIGSYRNDPAAIIVDARVGWSESNGDHDNSVRNLTFLEAGPRARHCYPTSGTLTVGVLVSGGIAPGINAVIESIVNRHSLYNTWSEKKGDPYQLNVRGYLEGFEGFIRRENNWQPITSVVRHK